MSRHDCKKMQKKCKKMQLYLHMSTIFCNFAPHLGIVPCGTIKTLFAMVKEEICKISIKGTIYRVTYCTNDAGGDPCFRVMVGRNIARGGSWFMSADKAIMHMLRLAFHDVATLSLPLEL